ncbi:alpha-amylase family glycosyl hydrolase [Bacillus sp. CBEL-1]|uniref:alpha-amylase family glycosyl hydrolase n=1 Tax=Bacillus sp. CBEL-1 TaxID=2502980 RepID=UPI001052CBCA|nr:alpha-amylase family glycosyl hydrolase [Bacillus sp. CBEL-1]TDB53257.1 alpha-amylase [Bacillus sp. CBEL-1]
MGRKLISLLLGMLFVSFIPVQADAREPIKDEIMYHVMVNRFQNGDERNDLNVDYNNPLSFYGGDIKGLQNRIPYIKDMGFTTIIITPVFKNDERGYHGYNVTDHYQMDERFGTLPQMKQFIEQAHKEKMKVVMELPLTISEKHPMLKDSSKNDWFTKQGETISLKSDQPGVQAYIEDVGEWWIKQTNLDGYYLTDINDFPAAFVNRLSEQFKHEKKGFYLIGEGKNGEDIKSRSLDLFVNQEQSIEQAKELSRSGSLPQLSNYFNQVGGAFLDSPRTERFTRTILQASEHPVVRTKQALTYLYLSSSVPIVYYGTEIALDGGKGTDAHRLMNFQSNPEIIEYITKLAGVRAELMSVRQGEVTQLSNDKGMGVYLYKDEGEQALFVINNNSRAQVVQIEEKEIGEDQELRGLVEGGIIRALNGQYSIQLDSDSSNIYRIAKDKGVNIWYISMMVFVYGGFLIFLIAASKKRKKRKLTNAEKQ